MKLSFVIPAYNEETNIGKCLDSVCEQAKKYGDRVEIIVVNNASTDRTGEIARSYPGVIVVDEPHKGLVWARKAGFVASSGDLIANVDSDTILTPGWLDKVFKEFEKNPNLVGLSGPFNYYDIPKSMTRWISIFYYAGYVVYFINRFVLRNGSMLQGGNFVVTREGLEKIGGYDTSIEFYGEDTDIARRLHAIGDVKFTGKLPMYSSGRRLAEEGMFTMAMRYSVNYFWMIFLKKPKNISHSDIRPNTTGALTHKPRNKKRERMIAALLIGILAVILAGTAFAVYEVGQELSNSFATYR